MPTIGLTKAVQKPQKAAHSKMGLTGLNKTIAATIKSAIPIRNNKVVEVEVLVWIIWLIQFTKSFFP